MKFPFKMIIPDTPENRISLSEVGINVCYRDLLFPNEIIVSDKTAWEGNNRNIECYQILALATRDNWNIPKKLVKKYAHPHNLNELVVSNGS